MMYALKNGEYYLTSEIDREDKLRGVLSEQLGRDAETWLNDVLEDSRNEERERMECKVALLENRVSGFLYHFDDYLKAPASFKRQLEALKREMDEAAGIIEQTG